MIARPAPSERGPPGPSGYVVQQALATCSDLTEADLTEARPHAITLRDRTASGRGPDAHARFVPCMLGDAKRFEAGGKKTWLTVPSV